MSTAGKVATNGSEPTLPVRQHRSNAASPPALPPPRRRGVVLVVVMIVVVALSLAAYAFSDVMLAENQVTHIAGRRTQAKSIAASGIAATRALLMLDPATLAEAGGTYDNPMRFQAIQVISEEEEVSIGRFAVVSPALDEEGNPASIRFGLENESSRLNLNALLLIEEQATAIGMENAGRDMLMALPGMSEDIADAILDWIDDDDEPREFGAEFDYYASLDPPYAPKNGPLETVEELLLVRDVFPTLLFGMDVNRNGLVDDSELQRFGGGGSEGFPIRGWSSLLTLHSKEQNVNPLGEPRIDLNMDDLQQLRDALSLVEFSEEWMTFIIAYRQNGAYDGDESGEAYSGGELDMKQKGEHKLNQVLDLIGAQVEVKFSGEEESAVIQSPFQDDQGSMAGYMSMLMDNVTIVSDEVIPGRISVNHAPRELLEGIPGMPEGTVEQILTGRLPEPDESVPGRNHEVWLLTEGLVTLEEMRLLSPFVCAGGSVYRAQSVGYFDDGSGATRLEVLLDATTLPPAVLLWRDVSHLGRGYPLEMLGVGTVVGE